MTLRFDVDWVAADNVRTPELAATWARLRIDVADVSASLVDSAAEDSDPRKRLDVPTYPLAEWIAFRWWRIVAPTSDGEPVNFRDAGDGFAWPDLSIRTTPNAVIARLTRRHSKGLRFLSGLDAVLPIEQSEEALARFVDGTVRRLEQCGITGTPLQEEWKAIQDLTSDEREFCVIAAALGLDPFDLSDEQRELVFELDVDGVSSGVRADLAMTLMFHSESHAAHSWAEAAADVLRSATGPALVVETQPLPFGQRRKPWLEGYERARGMRLRLGLDDHDPAPIDDLVQVLNPLAHAPLRVNGLMAVDADQRTTVASSGPESRSTARRFTGARALARRTFAAPSGTQALLTDMKDDGAYAERVERAFAAEFLAPAEGVKRILRGDHSGSQLERAAEHFGVSPITVAHQVDNQISA